MYVCGRTAKLLSLWVCDRRQQNWISLIKKSQVFLTHTHSHKNTCANKHTCEQLEKAKESICFTVCRPLVTCWALWCIRMAPYVCVSENKWDNRIEWVLLSFCDCNELRRRELSSFASSTAKLYSTKLYSLHLSSYVDLCAMLHVCASASPTFSGLAPPFNGCCVVSSFWLKDFKKYMQLLIFPAKLSFSDEVLTFNILFYCYFLVSTYFDVTCFYIICSSSNSQWQPVNGSLSVQYSIWNCKLKVLFLIRFFSHRKSLIYFYTHIQTQAHTHKCDR